MVVIESGMGNEIQNIGDRDRAVHAGEMKIGGVEATTAGDSAAGTEIGARWMGAERRSRRWLAPWKNSRTTPVLYHAISRVVDRRLVLERDEKEHFRKLMRMQEQFTGCRVLAYCVMGNHFHLLLEVPPPPEAGLSAESLDRGLFAQRLAGIYKPGEVAEVLQMLDEALKVTDGSEASRLRVTEEIAGPYLRRMHDLSEFMKGLLQRFTRWFNRKHERVGTLWENRFKSVIVESGTPARAVTAYIDLNPVRAGICSDPANYRWSGYGEAVGAGGRTAGGKAARGGLVRALLCSSGVEADASRWSEVSGRYRLLLKQAIERSGGHARSTVRHGNEAGAVSSPEMAGFDHLQPAKDSFSAEMGFAGMLMKRVRYFTDGAVIGSKECVDSCFEKARERFGPKRKSGARRMRGAAADAAGMIWTARDLQKGTQDAP